MSSWGPGHVIHGRYRLDSLLGQGGMGSVWKAEHLQLRSHVAVKLLDPAIADQPEMVQRFLREAQALAALRSPNVVQVLDFGVEDKTAFIIMEMLQGEPLSRRIHGAERPSDEELIRFLLDVLRAIGKAHDAGIVHRDLKPDNIFICRDEPEFAKVIDFGVAKVAQPELSGMPTSRTQTGTMIGTPYYMSPEQAQAKAVDARSDLWSIAIIAYECFTDQLPFLGNSFGELIINICTSQVPVPSRKARVPAGFDEWFVRGVQRDPARRFQSAREMAAELAGLLSPGDRRAGIGGSGSGRAPQPSIPSLGGPEAGVAPPRAGVGPAAFGPRVGALSENPPANLPAAPAGNIPVAQAANVPVRPGPRPRQQSSGPGDLLGLTTGQRAITSQSVNPRRASKLLWLAGAAGLVSVAGGAAMVWNLARGAVGAVGAVGSSRSDLVSAEMFAPAMVSSVGAPLPNGSLATNRNPMTAPSPVVLPSSLPAAPSVASPGEQPSSNPSAAAVPGQKPSATPNTSGRPAPRTTSEKRSNTSSAPPSTWKL